MWKKAHEVEVNGPLLGSSNTSNRMSYSVRPNHLYATSSYKARPRSEFKKTLTSEKMQHYWGQSNILKTLVFGPFTLILS